MTIPSYGDNIKLLTYYLRGWEDCEKALFWRQFAERDARETKALLLGASIGSVTGALISFIITLIFRSC